MTKLSYDLFQLWHKIAKEASGRFRKNMDCHIIENKEYLLDIKGIGADNNDGVFVL